MLGLRRTRPYSTAITLKPKNPLAYNYRSVVYCHLDKYQRAVNDCSKAIELKPDYADAYCNRAFAQSKLRNYQQVLADADKTISLKPELPLAHILRGLALFALQKYEEAIQSYTRLIEVNPTSAKGYFLRGASTLNSKTTSAQLRIVTERLNWMLPTLLPISIVAMLGWRSRTMNKTFRITIGLSQ
jgi:tetratricopeptide (TPR) repeat protein